MTIPVELDFDQRYRRFVAPLNRALLAAGRLGHCTETSTAPDPGCATWGERWVSQVEAEVTDRAAAAPVIAGVLATAAAPAGALVGDRESDTVLIHVTGAGPRVLVRPGDPLPAAKPRLPWRVGEVVGYRPTADRWTLLTVLANEPRLAVVTVADWCGPALPPAGEVERLVRRPPGRYACAGRYFIDYRRVRWDAVRLDRPPLPSVRRLAPTGVTLTDPPWPTDGPVECDLTPRQFARTLREALGLVPVDPATRLHHDHGAGGFSGPRPCLGVWDAGGRPVTPGLARRQFIAHCRARWAAAAGPLPLPAPPTPRTRRFVARLWAWNRGLWVVSGDWAPPHALDPVLDRLARVRRLWGWGEPWAARGYVVLAAQPADFPAVQEAVTVIARGCGLTVYDPQADRLLA